MLGRHVPTRRLFSGVEFTVPGEQPCAPPDQPSRGPKRRKMNIQPGRRLYDPAPFQNFTVYPSAQSSTNPISLEQEDLNFGWYPWIDLNFERPVAPEDQNITKYLPILSVSLTATIHQNLAHIELLQSFHNPFDTVINEARHKFPLYDGAVITAFECTIGDERRIKGVVKPKDQALQEYKAAVKDRTKAAALLEEHTPEVFETSLGNIPAMTTVEVKIVYVQELKVVMMEDDTSEGIALIIPTSIDPRSGDKSESQITNVILDINVRVLNDDRVNPAGCEEESGHSVSYEGPRLIETPPSLVSSGVPNCPKEYYVWQYVSFSSVLKRDFVFVVQMRKGHEMRSQAICCSPDDHGLAALMVNIRPDELFRNSIVPKFFAGEILFLLDRSDSMNENQDGDYFESGTRKIDVLREAMVLAISGIPTTCSFNIVSWGTQTWALWEESQQCSPDNISLAKRHISEMFANMGGTDLLRALKATIRRRRHDSTSTQIIIVTDGELDPKVPMEFIWNTRQALGNKIRFFALGIGRNVPHSLIESIGELGGGYGDVVDITESPKWHGRLNRLVRSTLEPDSWGCDIDIGDAFERQTLTEHALRNGHLKTQAIPYFQAPNTVTTLQPFRFNSIFLIIETKDRGVLPSEVAVTTTTAGAKKTTYKLPVTPAPVQDGTMHRLAAKAALIDLEDLDKRGWSSSRLIDENAKTLGTRYSITSNWTSFVATTQDDPAVAPEVNMFEHYKALLEDTDMNDLLTMDDTDSDDETSDLVTMSVPIGSCPDLGTQLDFTGRTPSPPSIYETPAGSTSTTHLSISSEVGVTAMSWPPEASRRRSRESHRPVPALTRLGVAIPQDLYEPYVSRFADEESVQYNAGTVPTGWHGSRSNFSAPSMSMTSRPALPSQRCSMNSNRNTSVPDTRSRRRDGPLGLASSSSHSNPHASVSEANDGVPKRVRSTRKGSGTSPQMDLPRPTYSFPSIIMGEPDTIDELSPETCYEIDLLDWAIAIGFLNEQGLFELSETARVVLQGHFCLNTAQVLGEKIEDLLSNKGMDQETSRYVLCDTLMMIKCYQTHLAQVEIIWDLVMGKAEDAVKEILELSQEDDTIEKWKELLEASMMHQHYAALSLPVPESYGTSTSIKECAVCNVRWRNFQRLRCPLDADLDTAHSFADFNELWKHQIEHGHMVCPVSSKAN